MTELNNFTKDHFIEPTDFEPTDLSQPLRSQTSELKYPRHLSRISSSSMLLAVSGCAAARSDSAPSTSTEQSSQDCLASAAQRRQEKHRYIQAHQQALQQRLQHRIEVAKACGDRKLLRQLEQEQALS